MNKISYRIIDGVECKRCTICKCWLGLGNFGRDKNRWDGLNPFCASCRAIKQRKVLGINQVEYNYHYRKNRKTKVLTHYGNGKCVCVRCGFTDIRALSIDHMNGNGAAHRREIGYHSGDFYAWLIRNNYPKGFQTLCMNCQWVKRYESKEGSRND